MNERYSYNNDNCSVNLKVCELIFQLSSCFLSDAIISVKMINQMLKVNNKYSINFTSVTPPDRFKIPYQHLFLSHREFPWIGGIWNAYSANLGPLSWARSSVCDVTRPIISDRTRSLFARAARRARSGLQAPVNC